VAVRASLQRGPAGVTALADALDEALRALAAPPARPGLAVVALGSYGRREQCRHSDIDVMLLLAGEPGDAVNAILYPLWDTGLRIGHSVRSIEQAVGAARQNVETLTSLLDARLVAGDAQLFERFRAARRKLVRGERRRLAEDLARQQRQLREHEPWQLQEPNLKTGRGGLRALQALRWLAAADALAAGADPPLLESPLEAARLTLLRARSALHALEERANDVYRQDLAAEAARLLGANRTAAGRALFAALRTVDATAGQGLAARSAAGPARRLPWRRAPLEPRPEPRDEPTSDLEALLQALRAAVPEGLDPLPSSDWLERLLPEWETQRCLPHVAPFHRHPVDVHSWRTVVESRAALTEDAEHTGTPEAAAALAALPHPAARSLGDHDELLLGALLHDIGKGHDGDHSRVGAVIAERVAARARLDPETSRRLVTVVEQHLLLPTVATRRDIADERVIRETADLVSDPRTLHLLYLVSVADARASGPDVWSPWKAQLMRSLYLRVLDVLETLPGAETASERRHREVVAALAGAFPATIVAHHLAALPVGYLLSTPAETIGQHLELIAAAAAPDAGGTAVHHDRVANVDRLTIATPDRPGILSLLAGTLAVHNVSVLGGSAYTRDDGVAIDVMYVADGLGHGIDDRRWQRICDAVPLALAGRFPIDERLAETRAAYATAAPAPIPTSVHVDNAGSDRYTIVEVTTADRLGLLYAITHALHSLALDIHLAKVDTIGREVVDAFYVLRENGRRVEARDEIERLIRRVRDAVAALDAPPATAST
jgi:[protein-PII] uridylyltransferase